MILRAECTGMLIFDENILSVEDIGSAIGLSQTVLPCGLIRVSQALVLCE